MRELDPRVAFAYRELSRLGDADFDAEQAAQVLGTDLLEAEDLIETLVDAQLLEAVGRSRWGGMRFKWQELVRLHASHCLTAAGSLETPAPVAVALTD